MTPCSLVGTAVAQWLMCCATHRKVAGSIPAGVIVTFHWHKILPVALWPWGRLSFWQKWVPGAFSEGKGGRCVRLTTLPLSCAVVMKSGNLNFLESSGPLQACKGTALPLLLPCSLVQVYGRCRSSTPIMGATVSSETSVHFCHTALRHVPEDENLNSSCVCFV